MTTRALTNGDDVDDDDNDDDNDRDHDHNNTRPKARERPKASELIDMAEKKEVNILKSQLIEKDTEIAEKDKMIENMRLELERMRGLRFHR